LKAVREVAVKSDFEKIAKQVQKIASGDLKYIPKPKLVSEGLVIPEPADLDKPMIGIDPAKFKPAVKDPDQAKGISR